ncbi:hypothetical protein AB9P05_03450 [Roseivirga sp. BDSF3-8]|uniref:hypothetical protein n=1 Tax=Roseivirga sp. BDSF3-8 TaxID=3241598 RepID=UPI0035318DC3
MKKKLSLDQLAVKSFKTSEAQYIQGGSDESCICSNDTNCTINDWYCPGQKIQ